MRLSRVRREIASILAADFFEKKTGSGFKVMLQGERRHRRHAGADILFRNNVLEKRQFMLESGGF